MGYNHAEFHPDPVQNDGALGFFEDGRPNKNKISSDVRLVPDVKMVSIGGGGIVQWLVRWLRST